MYGRSVGRSRSQVAQNIVVARVNGDLRSQQNRLREKLLAAGLNVSWFQDCLIPTRNVSGRRRNLGIKVGF